MNPECNIRKVIEYDFRMPEFHGKDPEDYELRVKCNQKRGNN